MLSYDEHIIILYHFCKNWNCWTQNVNFCNKIIIYDQFIIIHVMLLIKYILFNHMIIWLDHFTKIWHFEFNDINFYKNHMNYYILIINNNFIAKIDILNSTTLIFAKITWTIIMIQILMFSNSIIIIINQSYKNS